GQAIATHLQRFVRHRVGTWAFSFLVVSRGCWKASILTTCLDIPELDNSLGTSTGEQTTVGTEGKTIDFKSRLVQSKDQLSCFEVPYFDSLINIVKLVARRSKPYV